MSAHRTAVICHASKTQRCGAVHHLQEESFGAGLQGREGEGRPTGVQPTNVWELLLQHFLGQVDHVVR